MVSCRPWDMALNTLSLLFDMRHILHLPGQTHAEKQPIWDQRTKDGTHDVSHNYTSSPGARAQLAQDREAPAGAGDAAASVPAEPGVQALWGTALSTAFLLNGVTEAKTLSHYMF